MGLGRDRWAFTPNDFFENPVIVIYQGDFSTPRSCSDSYMESVITALTSARNDEGGRVSWDGGGAAGPQFSSLNSQFCF
ncbi:MAG: hypothetical protein ACFWUL_10580 [Dialister sp.]|jgi:hypothetical protein